MEFKKYSSIENHYQNKYIEKTLQNNPELRLEKFILQEKIDGANFQILIENDEIKFGKRTAFLDEGRDKFYDWEMVIKQNEDFINAVKNWLNEKKFNYIRLYGELFGSGIQKRIHYMKKKDIIIYDATIDGKWVSPERLSLIFDEMGMKKKLVPNFGIVEGIEKALEFDVENVETLIPNDDPDVMIGKTRNIEGIVIKPYLKVFADQNNVPFYIKKKSEAFKDVMKTKKPKNIVEVSENFARVQEIYVSHLTDNRIADVCGKYGEFDEIKKMGDYIKYILNDAKEDFLKNYRDDFMSLDEKERDKLFGITGKIVVPMLKKLL